MPPTNSPDGQPAYDRGTSALLALRERLTQTFFKPPKPKDAEPEPGSTRPMTDEEKRDWIRGLQPVERKWGFILGVYAALLSLITSVPDVVSVHYVREKITTHGHSHYGYVSTQQSAEILFAVQMALVAGILISSYYRKRPFLAFSLLIAAFASGSVLGIPLLILAGWLFMRSWRVQRYGSPNAKVAAEAARERRSTRSQAGAGSTGFLGSLFGRRTPAPSSSAGTSTSSSSGPRAVPEASKRYTPKKPKPKDTKGSRSTARAATARGSTHP